MNKPATELTTQQGRRLFDLINDPASGPHQDTVGTRSNPTTRTRAHAAPGTALHAFLKENSWLQNGTVLVCHGASCSDEFRITATHGSWTVSHIPVG
jgi:hypothetical protein